MASLVWRKKKAYAVFSVKINGKFSKRWAFLGAFDRKVDGHEAFADYVKKEHPALNTPITLSEIKDKYFEHAYARYSRVTFRAMQGVFKTLEKAFGGLYLHDITPSKLEDYKTSNPHLAENSIRNRFLCLKGVINYAKSKGYKTADSLKDVKIPFRKLWEYAPEYVSPEEINAVISALNEPHKTFALFLMYTGARPIELFRLTREDISPDKEMVRFFGKNKYRWVPLHNKLKPLLETNPIPFRLNYNSFRLALNRAHAKIHKENPSTKKITAYTFRHQFATNLLEKTDNLRLVGQTMGHSTPAITARYAWVRNKKQQEGINLLD